MERRRAGWMAKPQSTLQHLVLRSLFSFGTIRLG
jgi:hypothetical protein